MHLTVYDDQISVTVEAKEYFLKKKDPVALATNYLANEFPGEAYYFVSKNQRPDDLAYVVNFKRG